MKNIGAPISVAGAHLGDARHICAFFNSREDEYRVTTPFIKDGLECGHKAIHIIDPSRRVDHLSRLESFGIDTSSAQLSGQFELHDWNTAFFRDGPFDPDLQLSMLENVLESGRSQGFGLSRYVAHAEWALEPGASVHVLREFEARVNHIWPRAADIVICTYDLARFSSDVVIDAIRTHPTVIIGGVLQVNPFFVPPDEFLKELRERRRELA